MGAVFHVCSLWIVKCVSTCFGCRVTGFKGRLIFSMGFFLFLGRPFARMDAPSSVHVSGLLGSVHKMEHIKCDCVPH